MKGDGETLFFLISLYLETILILVTILVISLFLSGINENNKAITSCDSLVSTSDICSLYSLDNNP